MEFIVYTDGSCLSNPGKGGWAAVIRQSDGTLLDEISSGYILSTNNRMEICAAIHAVRTVRTYAATQSSETPSLTLYTDSQLLVNSIEQSWAKRWRANGWKRNKKDSAENPDLWAELLDELSLVNAKFIWVKAHVGTPDNERCDVLAKAAARTAVAHDEYYEKIYNQQSVELGSLDQQKNIQSNTQKPTTQSEQTTLFVQRQQEPNIFTNVGMSVSTDSGFTISVVEYNKTYSVVVDHAENGTIRIPFSHLKGVLNAISFTVKQQS